MEAVSDQCLQWITTLSTTTRLINSTRWCACVTPTETFLRCAYLRNDQMTELPRDMISPSYRASITINQIRSKCSQ